MRFPDETGKRLTEVDEQSSKVQGAWNAHEFVGLTKEVYALKQNCDEFLAWAREVIEEHSRESNDNTSS